MGCIEYVSGCLRRLVVIADIVLAMHGWDLIWVLYVYIYMCEHMHLFALRLSENLRDDETLLAINK